MALMAEHARHNEMFARLIRGKLDRLGGDYMRAVLNPEENL